MRQGRDPWFDNARWLAGSLVVLVHTLTNFMGDGSFANWLHGVLAPARVPLFAILVGYFTSPKPSRRDLNSIISMVAFPYAIITAAHVAMNFVLGKETIFNPLQAEYTLWFLTGVLVWRITVPLVLRFRYPFVIAVCISLLSGLSPDAWVFDLNRVLGLYPFVIIGLLLRRDDRLIRERSHLSMGVAAIAIVGWFGWITYKHFTSVVPLGFLSFIREYSGSGLAGSIGGMVERLILIMAMAAVALAVLHLAPRVRLPAITFIGQGGFTIYLLHGLVLRILWAVGLLQPGDDSTWWQIVGAMVFAFALAAALGSKPVRVAMKPLMRPKLSWLLLPPNQTNSFEPRPLPVATAPGPVHYAGEAHDERRNDASRSD